MCVVSLLTVAQTILAFGNREVPGDLERAPSKWSITEGSQAGEGQGEGSRGHLQRWVTDEQEPRVYSSF